MIINFSRLAILVGLLCFTSTQVCIADSEQTSAVKKQLVVASSNNFPPINLLDEKGKLTGFASDLIDAVARELDIEVHHIHSSIWPDVLGWLDEGEADLIQDTGYTPQRESYLDFSVPILEMPESIFVRHKQFDIINFDSLADKKVACVNQHITHIYLKQFSQINCYLVNTPAEGLIALIKGNVDAFIYPEQIVLYLAQDLKLDDEIKVVGDPLRVLSWSMTVKKGNSEVLVLLNAGINKVKESGEYQEIYDSWFGKQLFSGFSYQEVYLIVGAVVFPAILAVLTLGLLFYTHNMRRANKALIESQNNYRTLANNLPESVFLKDIHSVYIFCNKNFAESLGIEAKEIVGKTDFDLFPENAEQYRIGDKQVMQNKELIEFVESYKKEGSTGYINTIKTPVYNDDGELTGVLGIFWDITEQRQLQNKLSATIAEYNAITATVPDIMYKLDLDGNYLWWNKALENVTGLTAEQLKNSNARDIFVEQDRAQIGEAIQHVANDGYYEVGAKIIGRDKDIEYYFNGARLYDNNGEVIGLVGSGRDISKQKEAEEKHDKLYKQLLQSQKMEAIGQLTGGIAHDFNNMLAAILGYGELAQGIVDKDESAVKLQKYLSQIVLSGKRARDLVEQMLAFARNNKGKVKAIEVDLIISELVSMLRPMLQTSIELKVEIDNDLPVLVVDSVMMLQVLVNLCINARDAMEGHGTITIQAQKTNVDEVYCDACHKEFQGEYIKLSVSDTGHGIEKSMISTIFEPFMTTKDVGKGTGMGLAMVHGIVHDHDGHIHVQSEPGKTEFAIYLPITNEKIVESDKKKVIEEVTVRSDDNQHHVLVVEDEIYLSNLIQELLQISGYKSTVINQSSTALLLFIDNPDLYDLVITDQTMPGMTGGEIAKKMLEIKPELPVILYTGYSDEINEQIAKEIGIKVFIKKPFDNNVLLNEIHKLLST